MHEPLLLALLQKVYWLDDAIQDRFESQGAPRATRSDIFMLVNIACGTTNASDIARNLGISRQAVSLKLIDMQKRGMIDVKEDPADRRSKIVSFTESFQANADLCVKFMEDIEATLESAFGKKTMENFYEILCTDWSRAFTQSTSRRKLSAPRSQLLVRAPSEAVA